MSFTQHIRVCDDDACTLIACTLITCTADVAVLHHETGEEIHPAGTEVWRVHAHPDIHPEHRVNRDDPAFDRRACVAGDDDRAADAPPRVAWKPPCRACLEHPHGQFLATPTDNPG